jgi:hypothetical protein
MFRQNITVVANNKIEEKIEALLFSDYRYVAYIFYYLGLYDLELNDFFLQKISSVSNI